MWEEFPHQEIHHILVGWVLSEEKTENNLIRVHFRCCNKEDFYFFRPPAVTPPKTGEENVIRCFIGRIPNEDGTLSENCVLHHWEVL